MGTLALALCLCIMMMVTIVVCVCLPPGDDIPLAQLPVVMVSDRDGGDVCSLCHACLILYLLTPCPTSPLSVWGGGKSHHWVGRGRRTFQVLMGVPMPHAMPDGVYVTSLLVCLLPDVLLTIPARQ